jgi:Glycosyl transferase family 11
VEKRGGAMVIVQIIGGLGNQMFQYAAARRLAWFLNTPLKLDILSYQDDKLRNYGLHHLQITGEIASEEEIFWLKHTNRHKEKAYRFDAAVLNLPSDIYLEGYWQSEKYFYDIAGVIRQEFIVREQPDTGNSDLAKQIMESTAIAIHIRRGDYVTNPTIECLHGICPWAYYDQAVTRLIAQINRPHFFVFSDDWNWAQQSLKLDYPVTFVSCNGPAKDYEDLRLMSLCKHHIIANSSFSWWGAWLANHPGQLVFAPKQWFQGYLHDTRDLIPETWQRI